MKLALIQNPQIKDFALSDDGRFPNHPEWPLLLYVQIIDTPPDPNPSDIEQLLVSNNWGGCWRNGVFSFHHFHSNAHECLFCYRGRATVQFGGPEGISVELRARDAAVLPAGTAHKKIDSSADFKVIGSYPGGMNYDMNYGRKGERPTVDQNIKNVPLPDTDPLYGTEGPLFDYWC